MSKSLRLRLLDVVMRLPELPSTYAEVGRLGDALVTAVGEPEGDFRSCNCTRLEAELDHERRGRGLEQLDMARTWRKVERLCEAIELMLAEATGCSDPGTGCLEALVMAGNRALDDAAKG